MSAKPETKWDPTPGIYPDLSNEEYHASPGISNSGLGDIAQSPWHFWARRFHPDRPEPIETPSQFDGTLAHCAILEPDEFEKRYVVLPDDAPRRPSSVQRNAKKPSPETVKAIEWWDEWTAKTNGARTITAEQRDVALRQRDAVLALPDVAAALSKGRPEVSAFWHDPETGVLCKCRPDWVHEPSAAGVVLLDVKTYSDASPREFRRQIARMGYQRQAAYYSDGYQLASGLRVLGFIFVCVEMPWPHAASAVMLDDESIELGRRNYRQHLNTYAECLARDEWPAYSTAIELVTLPAYAFGE